jgi:hypothetical protein
MTQLFGAKKEPWVGSEYGGDRTEISVDTNNNEPDLDNDKTSIVEQREMPREAFRQDTKPPPEMVSRQPAQGLVQTQRGGPVASTTGTNSSITASLRMTPPPEGVDPVSWQNMDARQSSRNVTPPHQQPVQPQQQPPYEMYQGYLGVPQTPPTSAAQPLIPNQEISEVGAQPLVDEKLGWSTNVGNRLQPQQGSGQRLGSELADYKIKSNAGWILLAVLLVLGAAGAVVAILMY